MISQELLDAIWKRKARGERLYELAHRARIHRSTFSALINAIIPVRAGDPRVIRIETLVGVAPDDCFEHESDD